MKISDLREIIHKMTNIPMKNFKLIYCGRELLNYRTLFDYEVTNNSRIEVYKTR
jgi:hypothetical protein